MADTTPKQQRRWRPNKLNPSPSSVPSFPSNTPCRRSSRLRLRYPEPHPPHDDDDNNYNKRKRSKRRHSSPNTTQPKRRIFYNKVVYDEGEFQVGDDVYVKRRDGASSDDDDDPEVEDCRICSGGAVMIECDDCLGGFHLTCLSPF